MTQMGHGKIKDLRVKYRRAWGRDWPYDDDYLTTLWHEAKAHHGQSAVSKQMAREATETCLDLMRADHEFDIDVDADVEEMI